MSRVRHIFWAAAAIGGTLGLLGCRASSSERVSSAGGQISSAASPYVASGARPGAGQDAWVLGKNSLAVTEDGGGRWTRLPLPARSGIADVAVLPSQTIAVVVAGESIDVDTMIHGRNTTWLSRSVQTGVPVADARIVDSDGVLTGIMVNAEAGPGFSAGVWLSAANRESSWQAHATPVGGIVTDVRGLWLVGGATNSSIYHSTDQGVTWQAVSPPVTIGTEQQVAFSPAQATGGGVALTATFAHQVQVIVGSASGTSWHWTDLPVLNLGGDYGSGATATSSTADGVRWLVSPIYRVARVTLSTGQVSAVAPSGLPTNGTFALYAISKQRAFATYTSTHCAHGKTDCAGTAGLLSTTDGGQTWRPVADPVANAG